jgi:hypothetical protein
VDDGAAFTSAFREAAPVAVGLFAVAALLALALPSTALSDEELVEVD